MEAGFQLSGDIQINPQKINAYATAAILDTLTSVKTAFTEVKKRIKHYENRTTNQSRRR